jgi:hypothetical protein
MDRKNFSTSNLIIENKVKLSEDEMELIIENKKNNEKLYDDYINMIDNFYIFRNYYDKINFNTNINCVNKMTEEEKIETTKDINDANQYICSIMNKFENKLKLDINKYCDEFVEIKETDIKRLLEFIKLKNKEINEKYETLILNYNNNETLLNNEVDTVTEIGNELKTDIPLVIVRDFEKEYYNLIEQIHANMEAFEISDQKKLDLIEYISNSITTDESYEIKIDNLNKYTDSLLE